ncbi:MMPL family transporter [Cellulomonas marina]|uniref:Putative drug exporter of the RND superfamily n=1 Tax=Cellulomonas marina TaxID=988821 RepID=A0A1I0XG58_9CELL|nr:MMPL family transporter [Cellulomonas marina]GIG29845.1 RND transporter [Cellulomonas marina]SFB00002.1 putative drug exporter of the RND superfamily [Cellulomonas marina]
MSSSLYRLGRWVFRAHRRVAVLWLVVVVLAGGAAGLLNQGTDNTFSIPGTESGEALGQLSRTFPQVSGATASLVVVSPGGSQVTDPAVQGPVEDAVAALGDLEEVAAVTDPFATGEGAVAGAVSDDGSAAVVSVQLDGQAQGVGEATRESLQEVRADLAAALPDGAQVALGGDLFANEVPAVSITEGLGLLVALVVLVLTFGSLLAAGMPLLTAVLGVGIAMAGIFAATSVATISSTTPLLALMLGLAVGIDYALFIISRHQNELAAGLDPEEAAARSLATAGSAVVFAGLTVMIALVGLSVAGIPFLTTMGVAAAVAVGISVVIALTLTPALLGFAGERLRPGRRAARRAARRAERQAQEEEAVLAAGARGGATAATGAADTPGAAAAVTAPVAHAPVRENRFFAGWVRAATRWPLLTVVLVVGALGALTLPATNLRLALPDAGSQPESSGARQAYDLLAENFGEGYNGPLIVTGTIIGSTDPLGLMQDLADEIADLPGVAAVPLATPNASADTGIIQVVPEGGPDSEATKDLVAELRGLHDHFRDTYGVDLSVTGQTAVGIDISDKLGAALLPFGVLVVGLSFVLLAMVFRSLWVPLKATLGYLLSVGASFGVVSLVFVEGHGAELIGVDRVGPIISFMPIVLMGVLFGLAMDYEVFLVSRMREDYVHGGDARAAVRSGFLASAKVVTAAAVIMFSVFAAFVPEGDVNIKPIALGLAVGVFVDAFVVRMTLVPAVLQLLGDRAWHMPRRLDRVLPSFDVEGEGLARELALADWPEPGADLAIAAEGLRLEAPDGTPIYDGVALRVPTGGTLVVDGPHRSGRTALLLTLAGRAHADAGTLKVAGLVAPERAAAIRARVAVASLTRAVDPVGELARAFAARAPIVVVDDLDAVGDPVLRAEVHDEIARARAAAAVDGRPLTLVVSCLRPDALVGLLPDGPATVVDVPAHAAAAARAAVGPAATPSHDAADASHGAPHDLEKVL